MIKTSHLGLAAPASLTVHCRTELQWEGLASFVGCSKKANAMGKHRVEAHGMRSTVLKKVVIVLLMGR